MNRIDALSSLLRFRNDAIVVSVFSSAADWSTMSNHPLYFYAVGAMGQASSMGLGFAIGMPDRKVIVLDGDGSLLMNLGSIVTMASVAPKNLIYFVLQNNDYECIGSYPVPGKGRVNFSKMARAAGFDKVYEFNTIEDLQSSLEQLMDEPGPIFATIHTDIAKNGSIDENIDDTLEKYNVRFIEKMNELTAKN